MSLSKEQLNHLAQSDHVWIISLIIIIIIIIIIISCLWPHA